MERISVVIADDHPFLREGVRSFLASEPDLDVVGLGANGIEALQLVKEHRPTVLVTDVRMPVMDGLALLGELRKRAMPTRTVVLSVGGDPGAVLRLLAAGASGYVLKDRVVSDLVGTIRGVAAGRVIVAADIGAPPAAADRGAMPHDLAPREIAVLALLARGLRAEEIGAGLGVARETVEAVSADLYRKLGAKTPHELIVAALRAELIAV